MSFIPEVTPSLRIVKQDKTEKDKKQRKFYPESEFSNKKIARSSESLNVNNIETIESDDVMLNRRKGDERRTSSIKRGKWLESRVKKDRRDITKFYLSI